MHEGKPHESKPITSHLLSGGKGYCIGEPHFLFAWKEFAHCIIVHVMSGKRLDVGSTPTARAVFIW